MSCSRVTPVGDDPPPIAMPLWEKGYTYALIDETGEFTVNIPSSKLLKQVLLAGTRSAVKWIRLSF